MRICEACGASLGIRANRRMRRCKACELPSPPSYSLCACGKRKRICARRCRACYVIAAAQPLAFLEDYA